MNPSNPFGSAQSGAFQAPSNAVKPGPFQPVFGQQSSSQPQQQNMGFFGSGFGQTSSSGVFGHAPAFGQPAATSQPVLTFGQTSSAPQQAPVFGQGSTAAQPPPAFGQATTTPLPAPMFGQSSSTTPQQAPPAFGPQTGSVFGGATFGQSGGFGQGFGGHASAFGAQSTSEFSFKPANEAVFKPIFSASTESTTTTTSNSAFGGGAQPALTASSSSGLFSSVKPGTGGFTFSQPAVLPVAQQPTASTSSTAPTTALQFTFSQPATPNKATSNVTQPTTPSSFTFTSKTVQTQSKPAFGPSKFGQTFGEAKDKAAGDKESSVEPTTETNVFARLGKATKRKDDAPGSSVGKEVTEEETAGETDAPRQPPKRPLVRSRGPPPGLFGRALSGLRRETSGAPKREAKEQVWDGAEGGETERQRAATPPTTSAPRVARETAERPEGTGEICGFAFLLKGSYYTSLRACSICLVVSYMFDSPHTEPSSSSSSSSAASLFSSPSSSSSRLGSRRESTDSLGGLSPNDCTALHIKHVPPDLNVKKVLEKHFGGFGKVRRVYCKPQQNSAVVHFDDHASAARAKKKGQFLHQHKLILLWQKKKQSERIFIFYNQTFRRLINSGADSEVSDLYVFRTVDRLERTVDRLESTGERGIERTTDHIERTVDRPTDRPVPSSLLHLIGQTAETAEEKYRLLEQRDKILRQGRPKRADLNLSKAFVGTCPDMCPEKERYMRETRNQLSVYEVLPNTEMVDHGAAIKEYSRSSADQEEPLPHELRPLPVLTRTMDYIVTQVLDQGQLQDNYRDWYDFVWNRTRGIRKDIIQQDLSCPDTVALIEKCTRFHIHCAHQLCEEHLSAFDPKINNENMTKCLQSLKEMYQDLSTRGVYCPREAEFRQYKILLNLNEGDILREAQQLRPEVRNSVEVKFAVQAFSAVSNNNFVRFFKLVQSASYLSSCLLHGYFNQVRSRALKTLNMAHTVGPRSTTFPLDDIVRMLMFRDGDEASAFIQQYGLNVSDGVVELSRTSFQDPELPVSSHRSQVVMSKRSVLIGEVVNGGPLPNPPQHTPVCSFDAQNKYRDVAEATLFKGTEFKGALCNFAGGDLTEPPCNFREALDEKAALVSRCTEEVCSVLLEETLDSDIALLVQQILDVELQQIQKYIKRWRDVVFLRRQLKRQMRAFPAAPCFVDPRFRVRALAPSTPGHASIELLSKGLVNLGHSGNLTVEASWAPLDLPALVMQHLQNPPPKVFWKTLLLLPSEHETGASVKCFILKCLFLFLQLTDSLRWLLSRAPPEFPLSCQTLVGLVETGLSRDFSSRVYSHRRERASAGLPPPRPLPVIRLYNAVLEHIAQGVSSPELCGLSWPPVEFSAPGTREFVPHVGWNGSEHLKWIRDAILSLQLPEWDSESPTGRSALHKCSLSLKCEGGKVSWSSWAHTEEEEEEEEEQQEDCPEWVPWDDVLVVCIDHKLKDWTLSFSDLFSDLCSSIFSYAAQIPVSRRSRPLLTSCLDNLLQRVQSRARTRARTRRTRRTPGAKVQTCDCF
uniref:Germinal-center associated nuclear protein n=1 Tax=Periophthalmus magnuspinnatus TaxID=409849 RepID=A0A3B4AL85_9GOBI